MTLKLQEFQVCLFLTRRWKIIEKMSNSIANGTTNLFLNSSLESLDHDCAELDQSDNLELSAY